MSFPAYLDYKPTGFEWLGRIPIHWETIPIKRIGRLKGGAGFPHDEQGVEGEELDFHKVNALSQADVNGFLNPSENTISAETAERLGAFIFPSKTIVFAKVGAALLLGRIRELRSDSCIDNNMMGLVVQQEKFDVSFIRYAMELVRFDLIANPGAVPSLNERQIGEFRLSTPSGIDEQKAISSFLDVETSKIDGLVSEQRRLIELLKEKRQAVISHAVTKGLSPNAPMKPSGIQWLGDVPEHWKFGPLKRFWDVVDCKHVTVPFLEEGYPVASVMEVRTFELDLSRVLRTDEKNYQLLIGGNRQPQKGDVIYCRNTANTGTSAYVGTDEPICIGQDVVLIKSRQQNGRFLNYILHGEAMAGQLSQYMVGSTFKRINVADIRELIVTCPPKDEQDEIVKFIDPQAGKFDTLITDAERAIELLQERRTALISAGVTGKIDVRGFANKEAVA